MSTRWVGEIAQTCAWDSVQDLLAVHGHGGKTKLIWLDDDTGWGEVITRADIQEQIIWSRETFGPGERLMGVIRHMRKELVEVEDKPRDISEWVDLIILAIDGAQRQGYSGNQIIAAYHAKMKENFEREWPDWRDFSENDPIEHVRSGE